MLYKSIHHFILQMTVLLCRHLSTIFSVHQLYFKKTKEKTTVDNKIKNDS